MGLLTRTFHLGGIAHLWHEAPGWLRDWGTADLQMDW